MNDVIEEQYKEGRMYYTMIVKFAEFISAKTVIVICIGCYIFTHILILHSYVHLLTHVHKHSHIHPEFQLL